MNFAMARASEYVDVGKKCQLIMSFTPVRKGLQLLVPKKKARRSPEETSGSTIELRASSEPISCSLKEGIAFDVLARLLRNYYSIALDFFARQRPNSTLNAFREAALRGPRDKKGHRHVRLRVELPLRNGNVATFTAEQESPLEGEAYSKWLTIWLKEGQSRDYKVRLPFSEEEKLTFGDQTKNATRILGILKETPRPWIGRYECTFVTNHIKVLSDVGSVTCEFEKLYGAVVSVNNGTYKQALLGSKTMQQSARKRKDRQMQDEQ